MKEAMIVSFLKFWCVEAAAVSVHTPERYRWVFSLEVGEQQQVLWIQVPDRTSTYTQPVGDNMMAPPTSVYSVVTQHTHTPPALLAFQRWPEHTVSVSALNRPRREERTM